MNRLRFLRKNANMYLTEAAEKLGVSVQVLSRYERGERTPPDAFFAKAAELYNVPLSYLTKTEDMDARVANVYSSDLSALDVIYMWSPDGSRKEILIPVEDHDRFVLLMKAAFPALMADVDLPQGNQ